MTEIAEDTVLQESTAPAPAPVATAAVTEGGRGSTKRSIRSRDEN
jgi:hypothetical protein